MSEKPHHHRASLKQTNKSFKSKHASKSSLKDAAKGRTHRPDASSSSHSTKTGKTNANLAANQHKLNRRNHAKQIQLKKRSLLNSTQALFQGKTKIQRIVSVVPMSEDVDPLGLIEQLAAILDPNSASTLTSTSTSTTESLLKSVDNNPYQRSLEVVKFHNQSIRFIILPSANQPQSLFPILDGCAASDFIILGLSSTIEVNTQAETLLRCLTGTGVSSIFGVVPSLPSQQSDSNLSAANTRSSLHSFVNHFFPTIDKIHDLSNRNEATGVLRALCEKVPKGVRWTEARPRILAENVQWEPSTLSSADDQEMRNEGDNTPDGDFGTLVVEGVVRGARLDANRLVHLQGFGDFQVERILAAPSSRRPRKDPQVGSSSMDVSALDLEELSHPQDDDADSLVSTNVPDSEEFGLAEQTWPTEEEMASAPAAQMRSTSSRVGESDMLPPARPGTTPRLKKVPKGTSAYQAAWIIDESDEEDGDDLVNGAGEEQELIDMNEATGQGTLRKLDDPEDEEDESNLDFVDNPALDETATQSIAPFADLSPEQEEAQLTQYLADRAKERALQNKDDLDFPDEIDTPLHIPARERFARFRGLKSFRTSKWDPYEELPQEYSRCFMFEDYKRMSRKMEKKAQVEGVEAGTKVILRIKNVPRAVFEARSPSAPFVVFGLLKHEHKYSVMHFTVQRNTEYGGTVRSKDPLVIQVGPRRFVINPIFSAHTMRNGGRGANNVHKFERFLRHGIDSHVATAYLPITFGNSPAILLRVPSTSTAAPGAIVSEHDSSIHLVGTGSLLSADPTRITAKRLILTGHPFKVHKKTATIRYMFFNRADVEYFKPVQLRTKRGRTGHIREALGTHGYFKAGFDGPLDQMDQVMCTLYKRCYPKWSQQIYNGGLVGATRRIEVEEHLEDKDNFGDVEIQ